MPTPAETALEAARAALASWNPTTRRYRIGTREMEFSSPDEIIQVIKYWEGEVAREQIAAGTRQVRRIIRTRL